MIANVEQNVLDASRALSLCRNPWGGATSSQIETRLCDFCFSLQTARKRERRLVGGAGRVSQLRAARPAEAALFRRAAPASPAAAYFRRLHGDGAAGAGATELRWLDAGTGD